jgi:hypothetical protein
MSGLKLFSLGSLDITTGGSSVNVAGLTEVGTSIVKGLESTGLTLDSGSSIYFDINESNRMIITPEGSVGIGTSNPISELEVAGKIAITSELGASPTPPPDGNGWFYTKEGGAIYWQSHDVPETNLTTRLWEVDFYKKDMKTFGTSPLWSNNGPGYSLDYPIKVDGKITEIYLALSNFDTTYDSWTSGAIEWGVCVNYETFFGVSYTNNTTFGASISSNGISTDTTKMIIFPLDTPKSVKRKDFLQCFVTTNSVNIANMDTYINIVIENN